MASPALLQALRIDLMTSEVVAELASHGVEALLLKGPAIARELYEREGDRLYGDCDLLVPEHQQTEAERRLRALSFGPESVLPAEIARPSPMREVRARHWRRDHDGAEVDLHRSLYGVNADAAVLWCELRSGARRILVAGAPVLVPSRPALAFIITMHALQHRGNLKHPRGDLDRAIQQWPLNVWADARNLACRLGAEHTFAAGVALGAGGEAVLGELRVKVPRRARARAARVAESRERVQWRSARLDTVASAGSLQAWVSLCRRLLLPTGEELAQLDARVTEGGRTAVLRAYGRRQLSLARGAPQVFLAWRRARAGKR